MSSTGSPSGKYARYDTMARLIADSTRTGGLPFPKFYPFVLHLLENAYEKNRDIKLNYKFPEGDAIYEGGVAGDWNKSVNSALNTFDDFLKSSTDLTNLFSQIGDKPVWFQSLVRQLAAGKKFKNITNYKNAGYNNYDNTKKLAVNQIVEVNMSKYLLTLLLDNAYQAAKTGQPTSTNFFATQASYNDEKFYYRKADQPGKLFMLKNGVETEVQKGSKDYLEGHKYDDNCYNLGLIADPSNIRCNELVTNCLAGKDIAQCKDFMSNGDWWNQSNDVNNLNPALAMDMLSKFGFGIVENDVREVGLRLRQVMTTTQWLERLNNEFKKNNGLNDNDIKAISGNTRLIGYLDRVVNKINSNPAVLNKNYHGPETLSTNPNAFQGSTLSKFGLRPKQVISGSGVPSLSSIVALQNTVLRARSNIGILYGISPLPTGLIYQRGGAEAFEFMEAYGDDNRLPLRLSKIVKDAFESFVSSLKSNGKDLDANDKAHIHKLVDDLDKYENKLLKSAVYTDKYIKLLQVYGQTDSSSVLSMDHIQKFVDNRNNYFTKVSKKQDELLSILKAMADATNTEVKSEVKSITEYGKWE